MIYAVALVATVCLGLGWVLQQRVAARTPEAELSLRLLLRLMTQRTWWLGVASMVIGSALGGWALQLGAISLVEALLSANLLFAFIFAAVLGRARVKWAEVVGAVLLSAALGVFIAVGDPQLARHPELPAVATDALAVGVVLGVAAVLIGSAARFSRHVESAILAAAAGTMYGLQDMATRTGFVAVDRRGIAGMFATPWPYVVVGAGAIGIWLSQSAFHTARLDYSLPPTAAAEPVVGIALGITVLGDRLSVSPAATAVELLCLLAMVAGVILIGRAQSLVHGFAHLRPHHPGEVTQQPPSAQR